MSASAQALSARRRVAECVSVQPPLCFLDQLDAQRSRRKKKVTPVTFPPGRARLATSPADEALLFCNCQLPDRHNLTTLPRFGEAEDYWG
jgi:hypothetical protein